MNKKPLVSIIIVHYKNINILFECLRSIEKYTSRIDYEVVVVNNAEDPLSIGDLKIKSLRIVNNYENYGYGKGVNIGFSYSVGRYIFILNPDCILISNVIRQLLYYLNNDTSIGIVAPMLLNRHRVKYMQIGIKELNPIRSIIVLSFLSKLVFFRSIVTNYWNTNSEFDTPVSVDLVAGSVFLISRQLFLKLNGFDEKFFLYFEEVDLCKRVKDLGYEIVIYPKIKIIHIWKATTPKIKKIKTIFENSRRYYFRKHYGLMNSILVELVLNVSKKIILLILLFSIVLVLILIR